MTYAEIADGEIVRLVPRPNWLIGGETPETSRPLTDAELADHGLFTVLPPPEHDPESEKLVAIPVDDWPIGDGVVGPGFSIEALTPEELTDRAAARRAAMALAIDAERDRRADAGMTFNGVRYQTRPGDRENALGASSMAIGAISLGGGLPGDLRWHGEDQDFGWIAEDNSVTPMDAPTTFAFGKAMAAHKSALIFAGRTLKNMNPIPADFADDSYWP